MGKTDRLLFLVSLMFLSLFAAVTHSSAEVRELPLITPTPDLTVRGVDLNRADAETLCTLPGIGPATARCLIAKREELGGFRCLEELLMVRGIGENTLERLYEYMEE